MTIPPYAFDLPEVEYHRWRKSWPAWKENFEQINTSSHAASLLMIAAVESDDGHWQHYAMGDSIRYQGSISGLLEKKPNLTSRGMQIALHHYDLQSYGVDPLEKLTQVIAKDYRNWSSSTTARLLALAQELPAETMLDHVGFYSKARYAHDRALTAALVFIETYPMEATEVRKAAVELAEEWFGKVDLSNKKSRSPIIFQLLNDHASEDILGRLETELRHMYTFFSPERDTQDRMRDRMPRIFALATQKSLKL